MEKIFSNLHIDQGATLYTITGGGITAVVSDLGATLVRLMVPDASGKEDDVVLGYDTAKGYLEGTSYLGATVGRNANRIAGAAFTLGGKTCRLGGIAKGSGMIHPNMATMLVFLTTDAAITPAMLQKALSGDIANTFNMLSIDGDTSTNDMVTILANGLAGNPVVDTEGEDFTAFMQALNSVTVSLCRKIAGDGEGATKLLECKVTGAANLATAKTVAKSVICSSLLKAAMFGADANWGRVLCAIGYSGAAVDVNKVDVAFRSAAGTVEVCKNGAGLPFSEEIAKKVLLEEEIEILVELNSGDAASTAWGCDLTYDYVKINGDYRT